MADATNQRIARLTSLRQVLVHISETVSPIAPEQVKLADALLRVVARDPKVKQPAPAKAVALVDGYAVRAEATADASSYAPMPVEGAQRIDAGQPMPPGTDAVAPHEVVMADAAGVHVVAPVAAGDGVLAAGSDARPGEAIPIAGTQLRHVDLAALSSAGIGEISVRMPRVCVVGARRDAIFGHAVTLIERIIASFGADPLSCDAGDVAAALSRRDVHLIVVIGGSGSGSEDRSVQALAAAGRVDVHGVAIGPGETSALGAVGDTPVLVLPGRIDAALAGWLAIGMPLLRRLTGSTEERPQMFVTLERKVTSTVGLLDLVPVRVHQGKAMPLASGYLPARALLEANAYILVPAESEGYPEGALVGARLIP